MQRTWGTISIIVFVCATLFYLSLFATGTQSPQHTLFAVVIIVGTYGAAAASAFLAHKPRLAWASIALAVLGFPLLLIFAALLQAIAA